MCTLLQYLCLLGIYNKINNLCLPISGKKYVSIFSASSSLFVNLVFFCVCYKSPKIVASDFGRCEALILAVRHGHVAKFPLFTALIKVYFIGLKHDSCKKLANSAWVFFS